MASPFEITINVSVSSFRFIRIPVLWVFLNYLSAGGFLDVRF